MSARIVGLLVAVSLTQFSWAASSQGVVALAKAAVAPSSKSTDPTLREIEKYREALADGNPAELWEARGEDLWKQKRGPKNVSLEPCDLGRDVGLVKGVYASLPKYFADTDKVEDLESRLVTCMVMLQGFSYNEASTSTARPNQLACLPHEPMRAMLISGGCLIAFVSSAFQS